MVFGMMHTTTSLSSSSVVTFNAVLREAPLSSDLANPRAALVTSVLELTHSIAPDARMASLVPMMTSLPARAAASAMELGESIVSNVALELQRSSWCFCAMVLVVRRVRVAVDVYVCDEDRNAHASELAGMYDRSRRTRRKASERLIMWSTTVLLQWNWFFNTQLFRRR